MPPDRRTIGPDHRPGSFGDHVYLARAHRAPLSAGFFSGVESAMAKKTKKPRPWTKEDVRVLKTMAREKTKTTVIARKLKRTLRATQQKASSLGVSLRVSRTK